jgi:hypothetical protein
MADYQVIGPLAIVTGKDGKHKYLYTGAPVPSDIDKAQRDRLVADGLIGEVEASGGDVEVTEESAEPKVARPAHVAPRDDWEAYAVSRGTPQLKAKTMSKRELIDAHPSE